MKSASSRPSSSKEGRKVSNGSSKEGRKTSGGSSRSYSSSCTTETVKQSPRHKRIMDMTSREMTKSLIMEELSSDAPMQRSNSFHCNAKVNKLFWHRLVTQLPVQGYQIHGKLLQIATVNTHADSAASRL